MLILYCLEKGILQIFKNRLVQSHHFSHESLKCLKRQNTEKCDTCSACVCTVHIRYLEAYVSRYTYCKHKDLNFILSFISEEERWTKTFKLLLNTGTQIE
jgi:hypothetical protein